MVVIAGRKKPTKSKVELVSNTWWKFWIRLFMFCLWMWILHHFTLQREELRKNLHHWETRPRVMMKRSMVLFPFLVDFFLGFIFVFALSRQRSFWDFYTMSCFYFNSINWCPSCFFVLNVISLYKRKEFHCQKLFWKMEGDKIWTNRCHHHSMWSMAECRPIWVERIARCFGFRWWKQNQVETVGKPYSQISPLYFTSHTVCCHFCTL